MSSSVLDRKLVNPRWRASSQTLVPLEDFDYDEYVPTYLRDPENVPETNFRGWTKPNTGNNRFVDPVLKNDRGVLVNLKNFIMGEDPYSPWR